jgi:hypothetical protein
VHISDSLFESNIAVKAKNRKLDQYFLISSVNEKLCRDRGGKCCKLI